jgi:hypothetical protein
MYKARLFNAYGTPEAVLSTVLMGRELGLQATASLRAFHLIEGKHALAADAMRGLVLRSGVAKYFRCVERTADRGPRLKRCARRAGADSVVIHDR